MSLEQKEAKKAYDREYQRKKWKLSKQNNPRYWQVFGTRKPPMTQA